ncbi:hypothetical protein [La Joya virus]|uniref:Uncharacterized protein n=1 Tax=La Joya virus TaxID=1272946 RepID=A0A0D3R106_9RHAB|nr:hypothetical protein [La Joya virus]AJR28308.1 hypothetical protein [La Joya virus]
MQALVSISMHVVTGQSFNQDHLEEWIENEILSGVTPWYVVPIIFEAAQNAIRQNKTNYHLQFFATYNSFTSLDDNLFNDLSNGPIKNKLQITTWEHGGYCHLSLYYSLQIYNPYSSPIIN